jgi:hypothetical protein
MQKRIALAAALLLAAACERRVAHDELTLDFEKDDTVIVTAVAALEDDAARDAAFAGTDAWGVRFARLNAEDERVTFDKRYGIAEHVTRSMRIPRRDLQQVFSDVSLTATVEKIDGVNELRFYPGSGTRASREQQEHFAKGVETWSKEIAGYYAALHRLYAFMDANPDRARDLWSVVLSEEFQPVLFEEERPYADEVVRRMDELVAHMDEEDRFALQYAREADLIYNPFPARITIETSGDVVSREGFGEKLVIPPIDLLDAVQSLEGRWVSPDPLVALLRNETPPTADSFARLRRTSHFGTTPKDIADALRDQLTKPRTYAVRWRD